MSETGSPSPPVEHRAGRTRPSLPARLVLGVMGLVVVALLAFCVASVTALRTYQLGEVDSELRGRSEGIGRLLREELPRPFPARPAGGFERFNAQRLTILYYGSDGRAQTLLRSGPADGPDPLPDLATVNLDDPSGYAQPFTTGAQGDVGFRYRVLVNVDTSTRRAVAVAAPLTTEDATIERLLVVEGVLALVILALAAAAGWRVVRVGLRPLDRMTETATAIADGDLSHRVDLRGDQDDEVGRLGRALNSMLGQIEGAFQERELSEANLRRFVADASHELRTPLTSIRGYAELYRNGVLADPDSVGDAMRRIEDEATRMTILVDDLLLLARLDQGRPLERKPVDVVAIGEGAVRDLLAVDPDRPVTFEHDDDVGVMGDTARLHQVIANLLDNARVHTEAGTPVRVTIRSDDDHVVIQVADRGPGLEPATAARVFERSFRADTGGRHAGSGLGLSIVAAIAAAHGGQATVASAPGRGTIFTVRLPIGGDRSAPDSPSDRPSAGAVVQD